MNRIIAGLLAVVCLAASSAEACTRCGFAGRRCRFASVAVVDHHVAAVAVAPVVAAVPQVLTIQNNYNAPNGAAALIAPQGNTVYGLQAAAQPYVLDPAAVLRQAAELTKGAQQLASQGLSGYNSTASLALQLNAPANETLAKGVAASATLQAAGLSAPSQSVSQSLRITRQPDGRYSVEELSTPSGVAGKIEFSQSVAGGQQPQRVDRPVPQPSGFPLLTQHCAKCHGADQPSPKGGVYIAAGSALDGDMLRIAMDKVATKKMPPGGNLDCETQLGIVRELAALLSVENGTGE